VGEFLLFGGLIALAAFVAQMKGRIEGLEAELARLRDGLPPGEAARDTSPQRRPEPPRARPAADPRRHAWVGALEQAPSEMSEVPPEPKAAESLGGLFERLIGGRLLIWIGGIALALAGMFLIRHSIQIGLITPPVRMMMAAAFGLLLVAAGEYARSRADSAIDPRAAQALVGAGILVLYGAAYGAHVLYGLIGMRTAAAAMIAVTGAALVLALRHGAPAAVMGLVGGFATPLLVGSPSETSVPLLTYLGLLNFALFGVASRRGWTWLAAAAVLLSFAWTFVLVLLPPGQALPAGIFILVLAVAASLVRAGSGWELDFIRPGAIALAELAILVARNDLTLPAWALFGLLSLACFLLASRRPEYRIFPAFALALALLLLAIKAIDLAPQPWLPETAAGIALLFVAGALPGALRGRRRLLSVAVACGAAAGPILILRAARPELLDRPPWGALFAAAALLPLLLAWRRRRDAGEDRKDGPLTVAAATALLLLAVAAWDLVPPALAGAAWLLLALGAALAARLLRETGLSALTLLAAALATAWTAAQVPELWATALGSLAGEPALASALPPLGRAAQALALPALLLLAIWRVVPAAPRLRSALAAAAAFLAVAAAYVLAKEAFHLSDPVDFAARGFAERTVFNQALFLLGWLVCAGRLPLPGIDEDTRRRAGILLTGLAAARLVWFDMLIHNPALVPQHVGPLPVLNLLAPAYLLGAFWLYKARRSAWNHTRSGLWLVLFLAALTMGVMLMVRQLFQGTILSGGEVPAIESYGYSLAALLLAIALLLSGIRVRDKALRLAGLLLLTGTILKVFLLDAAALEGVLRILSFLGLGIALIGIGKLYAAVLRAEAAPREVLQAG
jgi:uncharacterized membrane protein